MASIYYFTLTYDIHAPGQSFHLVKIVLRHLPLDLMLVTSDVLSIQQQINPNDFDHFMTVTVAPAGKQYFTCVLIDEEP